MVYRRKRAEYKFERDVEQEIKEAKKKTKRIREEDILNMSFEEE